jgi:hypothetical protein
MSQASSVASPRSRARAVWGSFVLADNERVAAACVRSVRDEVRALAQAAGAHAAVADRLLDGHAASALALYREATVLYMAAVVAARTGETPVEALRAEDVLARFRALSPEEAAAGEPEGRAAFLESVRAPDPRAAERLPRPEALLAAETARAVVRSLAALVEPRSLGEIRFIRRARLVALGAAALGLAVWLATLIAAPPNLALHKPVTTSGVHPSSTSPPAGLTDGVRTGDYGVHTSVSDAPWVTVDLLGVYLVDAIKVYNRGDGWFDEGLPMTVQLSQNGADFVDVATRTTSFGQLVPWTIEVPRRAARYVRVRGPKGKYVALTELEVFGARP